MKSGRVLDMGIRALLISLFAALPALAETPISPDAFDRITRGKTFTFGTGRSAYGAEEYLPGRRVRWSFLDGRCVDGTWFVERGLICFAYEGDPDQHCWEFFLDGDALAARFEGDPENAPLYEVERSSEPLYCMGPDIGV